jgi:hypothetical protein
MDPIDRIAQVFADEVRTTVCTLQNTIIVVNNSVSYNQALYTLHRFGVKVSGLKDRAHALGHEIDQLNLFLQLEEDIKTLARKALLVNFYDSERVVAFNQEICFSYACKFLSSVGPRRGHFSNATHITAADIQRAEIQLAMTSPNLYVGEDLYCYEIME